MAKRYSFVFCLLLLGFLFVPTFAEADSSYKNPNESIQNEASDGFKLNSGDVSNFEATMQFLRKQESYIFVKKTSNGAIYYFNTPNVPLNTANMLQNINKGGWAGNFTTVQPVEGATDALKRYGYTNPDYYYLGERPIIFLSLDQIQAAYANVVTGIKVVISFALGGIFSLFGSVFNGEIASLNPSDLSNLSYENEDYIDASELLTDTLSTWLEKAWNKFPTSQLKEIKIGDKGLDTITDSKKVGSGEGQLSGQDLLQKIIDKSGNNYITVLNALLEYASEDAHKKDFEGIDTPDAIQIRNMPYDLDSMSKSSRDYMGNISDPRVTMYGSTALLGFISTFLKQISHSVSNVVLAIMAFLCFLSGALNSICDMNFLRANGIEPMIAWTGTIGTFLTTALLILTVLVIVKIMIDALRGHGSFVKVLIRGAGSVILAGIVIAIFIVPQTFSDFISNTATRIMSVGATAMQTDDNFKQYYVQGQSSQADISALRYWYAYHNCWTEYVTGHAVSEDANVFDINQLNQGHNEYKTLEGIYTNPAQLSGGKQINNWSAILLDNLEQNDTKSALRAVDHFMAPTIQGEGYPNFKVSKNQFYDGIDMYSSIPWAGMGLALVLVILTGLKFVCFIGFLIDFILLLVKFALGALGNTNYIKECLVNMLKELLKVVAYDIFISFAVYATSSVSGAGYSVTVVLLMLMIGTLVYYLIKHPDFILVPALFAPIKKTFNKVKGTTKTMVAKQNSGSKEKIKSIKTEMRLRKGKTTA